MSPAAAPVVCDAALDSLGGIPSGEVCRSAGRAAGVAAGDAVGRNDANGFDASGAAGMRRGRSAATAVESAIAVFGIAAATRPHQFVPGQRQSKARTRCGKRSVTHFPPGETVGWNVPGSGMNCRPGNPCRPAHPPDRQNINAWKHLPPALAGTGLATFPAGQSESESPSCP